MRLVDLSHVIREEMPVYPGTETPVLQTGCTVAEHGFLERKITMFSHTGTHMDAPAHMLEAGKYLDDLPVSHFFGRAVLIDAAEGPVELAYVAGFEDAIAGADFVLLRTGWSRYWGTDEYFGNFPTLTPEAAAWLADKAIRGVGVDAISVDPMDTRDYAVHMALLGKGLVIVENLTGLEALPAEGLHFSCFPLPFREADGSPVRAVAYLDMREE